MVKWEYLILTWVYNGSDMAYQQFLMGFGAQGWELASVYVRHKVIGEDGNQRDVIIHTMKRKKDESDG